MTLGCGVRHFLRGIGLTFIAVAHASPQAVWTAKRHIRESQPDQAELRNPVRGRAAVASNGKMYAIDYGPVRIVVFGADGKFERVIGREGKGPGEIQFTASLGFRGDSLWWHDPTLQRITVMAPGGTLRTEGDPRLPDLMGPSFNVLSVLPKGRTIFAYPYGFQRWGKNLLAQRLKLVTSFPGGNGKPTVTLLDTLHRYDMRVEIRAPGLSAAIPHPWTSEDFFASTPDGGLIALAQQDGPMVPANTFVLTIRTADGSPTRATIHFVPKPPRDTAFQDWLRETTGEVEEVSSMVSGGAKTSVRKFSLGANGGKLLREALGMPATTPPVRGLLMSADSMVWVLRERTGITAQWQVFDRKGKLAATVSLPESAIVLAVGRDVIWCAEPNDDGLHSIVRYRIDRRR